MDWINIKINPEGLKDLEVWVKEKLAPEEQDRLAEILDKIVEVGGIVGAGIELMDGKLFKTLIAQGVTALFPGDENLNPTE